jgi:hypothetical protein
MHRVDGPRTRHEEALIQCAASGGIENAPSLASVLGVAVVEARQVAVAAE